MALSRSGDGTERRPLGRIGACQPRYVPLRHFLVEIGLRVDAEGLIRLSEASIADGFQVTGSNPLVGMTGRVELLRRLGALIAAKPDIFARKDRPRPGAPVRSSRGIDGQSRNGRRDDPL